jgi:23S rRNA (uracil1939-C5)-methyltransferase
MHRAHVEAFSREQNVAPDADAVVMEIVATALASGGRGLGRAADGRVVLVEGALAGERVRAVVVKEHRDYLEAKALEVMEPSPDRVEPACPLYGDCGGCDLMHLAHGRQVEAKTQWVSQALRRISGLPEPRVITSPQEWGYRQRVRFQVEGDRLGFHARASHRLVEAASCPVAHPAINRVLPGLAQALAGAEKPSLAWIEVLAGDEGAFVTLGLERKISPPEMEPFQAVEGVLGVRPCVGDRLGHWPFAEAGGVEYFQMAGLTLRAFPGMFCQANLGANRLLIQEVLAVAGQARGGSALDMFAGSGNFGLPLAQAGWQVLAVEADRPAVVAANWLAAQAGLGERFEGVAAQAGQALPQLVRQKQGFGLVVLDPPRGGAKGLMAGIKALEPRRVIYVSCHPATLARDAVELAAAGYVPRSLTMVDMFPQTGQVEAMLVLQRD